MMCACSFVACVVRWLGVPFSVVLVVVPCTRHCLFYTIISLLVLGLVVIKWQCITYVAGRERACLNVWSGSVSSMGGGLERRTC